MTGKGQKFPRMEDFHYGALRPTVYLAGEIGVLQSPALFE